MEDTDELLAQICTRIGIIMEDASATAILAARMAGEARNRAIAEIAKAAADICALSNAAAVLSRSDGTVAAEHH
ncbi:hypothetical protein V6U71_16410 [Sphingopyxis sp. J-6]|uniref:hypothetical protein n=1 Tax=Sphingopyxis sp. J-6 TaxID=3122054 RepID=UPI003983F16A